MQCAFERGQTQPNAVQIRARSNPTKCMHIRMRPNPTGVHSNTAKPNRMQCAFKRAKPNRMQCAFECGQTQPNAVHNRVRPTVRIRARQIQPNAVSIQMGPNPTECSAHSNVAKPNRMRCTFERGQTNPGHRAASASWGSHFCPLKTKVLLNGCPMHAMKAMNKGYTNHHGQHKSVQKWVCKPAFMIWLVPGFLPSKWDNGTSHAIFRFCQRRMGCPISENAWDVPCQKSQLMGRPILDGPST
ncbi:hypothetical protein K438DRAFT_2143662 [Mycena galopus ATCC 62051]|nr:hypothetical protein K438DRAFT_2143662 [Mycena galopus ATCC 62051]